MKLAYPEKLKTLGGLSYPLFVTPKIKGVRCAIINGQPMTKGQPVTNHAVRDILNDLPQFDGVLVIGRVTDVNLYETTYGQVMNDVGVPDFMFWISDLLTHGAYPFNQRFEMARAFGQSIRGNVAFVNPEHVKTEEALFQIAKRFRKEGFTGISIRNPDAIYGEGWWECPL